MKRWISLLILLWPLTLQANDTAFKRTKKHEANMGPGCNVSLKIPVTGKITIRFSKHDGKGGGKLTVENPLNLKTKEYIAPFYFGFTCYSVDDGEINLDPVRFDTARNEWVRDIDKRIAATGTQWSEESMMNLRRDFARAIKLYPLNNINARGYAYTEDDLNGDEEGRQRTLYYCLIRNAKTLCGRGKMGYLEEGKKGDLTPYVLEMLRSIEFLEDADPIPSAPIYSDE
ncbi:hypothetical protein FHW67_004247 [Herbaspirillum sp. Sphag1AN]|uniref:hypothetical protein n=1 Tax=unclassified Herbaspirillum TaxID=2624150 RepID=UPI00161C02DF|nr:MULTISPECIES: hypothetical protein [unclassified Herbaspirillum]MBB3214921.1 hypothetical protein [Herbaspirillum sp. Sphag1AN]MBB3248115.1 hypothetical protein [Herbaspirillum sp. Sphag64]